MAYPLGRPLPNTAEIRSQAVFVQDTVVRELLVRLCDALDYLNAKVHTVADATAVPLEE